MAALSDALMISSRCNLAMSPKPGIQEHIALTSSERSAEGEGGGGQAKWLHIAQGGESEMPSVSTRN